MEGSTVPSTRQAKARHQTTRLEALDLVSQLQNEAALVEEELEVVERWTPNHARWDSCMKTASELEYESAFNRLEGLVVQRLAELKKAHMAKTGMASSDL